MPDVSDLSSALRLYPEMDVDDASHMIYHLPGSLQAGTAQLARWEVEISQMLSDLNTWTERVPVRNPATGEHWGHSDEHWKGATGNSSVRNWRNSGAAETRTNSS
ncbi:hypothetical protein RCC30_22205 [Pseudomonas fluorescens]|nr:hypothetical protein RCC30_22205 [Pseudomonas fluorescens]